MVYSLLGQVYTKEKQVPSRIAPAGGGVYHKVLGGRMMMKRSESLKDQTLGSEVFMVNGKP